MQKVPRLIEQFVPDHYDISLALDKTNHTFAGNVAIHGLLRPNKNEIILHAKELSINSVTLDGKSADFTINQSDELRITQAKLSGGQHTIVVVYTGVITDSMHGLYFSHYQVEDIKKELLVTQFESHHAREVFPGVDEPEAKATFDVTLTTEQNITVLGNMPVKWQRVEDNQLVTAFETSPRMSTYLLAWVIGELNHKSAKTNRGVEVNVWATPAQPTQSLDFALDIAVRSIEFYEQYFDTEYPLPKSDHVAIPDFTSGAMENWGLVIYREIALLADPATSSISQRQYIASVIAHELAHQWFGNLVTMKWWNNLWLNESFATLMQYIAVDRLEPSWNVWLDFTQEESIAALRRDSIAGVQPVQTDVNHPDEIITLFDGAIVYAKGARLLHMLMNYVGQESFQAGLKKYFKDFAYKNTEGNDLWDAIAETSSRDIVKMMNTWISQPGYPVLHVSKDEKSIHLSQEQFFIGPHASSDALWPIPLNSNDENMPSIMTEKELTVITRPHTPLHFNIESTAHFITHYDDKLLVQLIDEVSGGSLSITDRLQLLHEATLLVRGGILPSTRLLNLLEAYRNETSQPVWSIISLALAEIRKFVEDDEIAEQKLRKLSSSMAKKQLTRLGWIARDDETEEDTKLRAIVISLMLYGEDEESITQVQKMYHTTNIEKLDAELRPLILSAVVRHGDDQLADNLIAIYKSTQSSELRDDITYGITSTKSQTMIVKLLSLIEDSNVVRPQDVARWFVYLIRNRESRSLAWAWIRDNWQWVFDTFSGDKSYDAYPRYSASALMTRPQLAEYIEFFTPKKDDIALTRAINMGISEIEGRIDLIERDGPAMRKALHEL